MAACGLVAAGCGRASTARSHSTTTVPGWGSSVVPHGAPSSPAVTSASPAPVGLPSAGALVAKAMANALASGWAHIDVTTTSGASTVEVSDDVGLTSGRQVVTANGARAEALLVDGVAYARGDATSVSSYFGVPAPEAALIAGQWASFTQHDQGYPEVASRLALSSVLTEDALTGPYRLGAPTVVDGQRVVPVSGIISEVGRGPIGLGTLYITPGSGTLPVELDTATSAGTKTEVRYSRWGAAVVLTAPSGATPAASLVPDPG